MGIGALIKISLGLSVFVFTGIWLRSYYHRTKNKALPIILVGVSIVGVILFLGNYHIVSDTREVFIKRPYFGFNDTVKSIDACTEVPYFIAMSKHQSLCEALQKAGYLETDEARKERINKEIEEEMKNIKKGIEGEISEELSKDPSNATPSLETETSSVLPSCKDECSFQGQKTCQGDEVQTCEKYVDNCLKWRTSKTCEYGCSEGKCNSPPLGHSRGNPVSAGKSLTIWTGDIGSPFDDDAYKVKVNLLKVVRGTEVWNRLKEASGEFTEPQSPDAGFEYLLAKVKFDLLESKTESSKFTLSSMLFSAVSSEGKEYKDSWVTTPEPRLDADLYEGASQTGWLLFEVKKDDSKPLMTFGRNSDGTGGIWFKLY